MTPEYDTDLLPPVVVTGAASGIGAALMETLRDQGRDVIGLDQTAGDGILTCDLSDPASIKQAVEQLPDRLGGLANVAGVPGTAPPETVLRVNVLGPKLLTDALSPLLTETSAVVNLASVAAHRNTQPPEAVEALIAASTPADLAAWVTSHSLDGPAAYDTSKRVIVDWTLRLAAGLLGSRVRALSVSPGPVETSILDDFTTSMGQDSMDRSIATVGRHGRPAEIASVVGFALSPEASWLNGIDIPVEGGLTAARASAGLPAVVTPEHTPARQHEGSAR